MPQCVRDHANRIRRNTFHTNSLLGGMGVWACGLNVPNPWYFAGPNVNTFLYKYKWLSQRLYKNRKQSTQVSLRSFLGHELWALSHGQWIIKPASNIEVSVWGWLDEKHRKPFLEFWRFRNITKLRNFTWDHVKYHVKITWDHITHPPLPTLPTHPSLLPPPPPSRLLQDIDSSPQLNGKYSKMNSVLKDDLSFLVYWNLSSFPFPVFLFEILISYSRPSIVD